MQASEILKLKCQVFRHADIHKDVLLSYSQFLYTCPTLMAPNNGDIDCSLGEDGTPTKGDNCTFTCDYGYRLRGSTIRGFRTLYRGISSSQMCTQYGQSIFTSYTSQVKSVLLSPYCTPFKGYRCAKCVLIQCSTVSTTTPNTKECTPKIQLASYLFSKRAGVQHRIKRVEYSIS